MVRRSAVTLFVVSLAIAGCSGSDGVTPDGAEPRSVASSSTTTGPTSSTVTAPDGPPLEALVQLWDATLAAFSSSPDEREERFGELGDRVPVNAEELAPVYFPLSADDREQRRVRRDRRRGRGDHRLCLHLGADAAGDGNRRLRGHRPLGPRRPGVAGGRPGVREAVRSGRSGRACAGRRRAVHRRHRRRLDHPRRSASRPQRWGDRRGPEPRHREHRDLSGAWAGYR